MSAGRAPRVLQTLASRARSGLFNIGTLQAELESAGSQIRARLPLINQFAAGLRASHLVSAQDIHQSPDQEPAGERTAVGERVPTPLRDSGPSNEPDAQDVTKPSLGDQQEPSPRHDLAMVFTCSVCETRSAKTMNRETYAKGVVIVRCPGCKNLHLISDRLGWFGEPGSVEDFLAQKGLEVRTGNDETYQFSLEDLTGWTPKDSRHDTTTASTK